jgi:endonuclease/exonuclease/phosphatase family metal-dependent hydrolase
MRTAISRGVAFALAITLPGCATARNYSDPSGPVFVGRQPVGQPVTIGAHGELRIVTFNIEFGEHVDGAIDLLSRAGPLHSPDILILQEMDLVGVERLSHALALNYVFVPSAVHPSSHRDFGVAILSPWPMADARKIPLPHQHRFRKLRRAAAAATIHASSGVVLAYAVHLETQLGASDADRRDQADAVVKDAEAWSGPLVIAGDFNGGGGVQAVAASGFLWLTRKVRRTSGMFAFDHILVRGLCPASTPAAAKGLDVRGISDHRPVWAVVRPCSTARTR